MPKKLKTAGDEPVVTEEQRTTPVVATADPVDADAIRDEARAAERQRGRDIRDAVRDFGFDAGDAEDYLAGDQGINEVRAALQKKLAEKTKNETPNPSGVRVGGQDSRETAVDLMTNALQHRVDPGNVELLEGARQYRGMTLIDMARASLDGAGVDTSGMLRDEIADYALAPGGNRLAIRAGMHTTSDFPIILGNTVNRNLRDAYEAAPKTYQPIARRRNATDFRPIISARIGDNPRLLKTDEHGEFKRGTIGEASEQYAIDTFGRIIGVTRKTLVNDDLDAFTRLPTSWGVAAAALENEIMWGLITANGAMSDGDALFHANHRNLAAAAVISVTSVGKAREAMRNQRSLSSGGKKGEKGYFLRVAPAFLIAPVALETVAAQFLSALVVPTKDSDINPWKTSLELITEPLLDENSKTKWYMAASPGGGVDTLEYAFLEGRDGVYTETRVGFDVDGIEMKARSDFGGGVIDSVGLYRNG